MCGLVGAGKTTVARQLAAELPALRLSRDEWMLRLHGGAFDDRSYIAALGPCTEALWQLAEEVLALGSDVVLDWNHWSRELRSAAARRANGRVVVHYVDVSVETAIAQAAARTDADSHALNEAGVRHMATLLELPDESEGVPIVVHSR
jgi:predicted kinase